MTGFTLKLYDSLAAKEIEGVHSFVGEDHSGSFGVLAGHARMMTCLAFGLCRFKTLEDGWQYLALPGALLYFADDVLHLHTRRYYLGSDYENMASVLENELLTEDRELESIKSSVRQLERAMLKRLWESGRYEDGHL
jgi:F-type H+-transporting ATPase subunit epsilon